MVIYGFDFWEVFPAVVVFGILGLVLIVLVMKENVEYWQEMPLHRLWYRITKRRRTKKGGLKYICYNPKKDLFYCKHCKELLTREDYNETEYKTIICPCCGQRLGRIFWI